MLVVKRMGLTVSPERVFRTSSVVYIALGMYMIIPTAAQGHVGVVAMLLIASIAVHIFHISAAYVASQLRRDYPWRIFRWTFPLAFAGFATSVAAFLAQMPVAQIGLFDLLPFFLFIVPGIPQVVLLWWPRRPDERPEPTTYQVN